MATLNLQPADPEAVSTSIRIDNGKTVWGDVFVPDLKDGEVREGMFVHVRLTSGYVWQRVKVAFIEDGTLYCRAIAPVFAGEERELPC